MFHIPNLLVFKNPRMTDEDLMKDNAQQKSKEEIQAAVYRIQAECLEGKLTIPQGVNEISEVINGITGANYKPGIKCNVVNHAGIYRLNQQVPKKKEETLFALLIGLYDHARRNGCWKAGELHLGYDMSTRHHTTGVNKIREKYGLCQA